MAGLACAWAFDYEESKDETDGSRGLVEELECLLTAHAQKDIHWYFIIGMCSCEWISHYPLYGVRVASEIETLSIISKTFLQNAVSQPGYCYWILLYK